MRRIVASLVLLSGCDVTEEQCNEDFEACMVDCRHFMGGYPCQIDCIEGHDQCLDAVGEVDPNAHDDVLFGLLAVLELLEALLVDVDDDDVDDDDVDDDDFDDDDVDDDDFDDDE